MATQPACQSPVCTSSQHARAAAAIRRAWQDESVSSPDGRRGPIIFLNGTSSSGKSSIAEQLLLMLDRPHFYMAVDTINGMRARQKPASWTRPGWPRS